MTNYLTIIFTLITLNAFAHESKIEEILDVRSALHNQTSNLNKEITVQGYYAKGVLYQDKKGSDEWSRVYLGVSFKGVPTLKFHKNCEKRIIIIKGIFTIPRKSDHFISRVSKFNTLQGENCLAFIKKE